MLTLLPLSVDVTHVDEAQETSVTPKGYGYDIKSDLARPVCMMRGPPRGPARKRLTLLYPTDSRASPNSCPALAFTSVTTRALPSRLKMSISPTGVRTLRPMTSCPLDLR